MADALCGPSSALQTFQKHTTVDRSLQQDRFGLRQSPSQGFRSSPRPNASNLDAEFQAFQAGAAISGAQTQLDHGLLPHFGRAPQPQLPSWASDFQQMNLNEAHMSPVLPAQLRHQSPLQRSPQISNWHQEFMQQPVHQTQQSPIAGRGFLPMQNFSTMGTASNYISQTPAQQTQQAPQQMDDLFDETAFERAFDAAQEQATQSSTKGKERALDLDGEAFSMDFACTDPGDILGDFDFDSFQTGAVTTQDRITDELATVKRDGGWEALNAYERALDKEIQETNSQQSRDIVDAIRNMRAEETHDERTLEPQDPIGADTISPDSEQNLGSDAQADELSRTAGQLLDNLREEQSQKFQQSNFMELMRQLRDKEMKVEGDKMVPQPSHPGGQFYPSDAFLSSSEPHADHQPEPEYSQVGA